MINDILQSKFCLQGEQRKGIQQNDSTMQNGDVVEQSRSKE